LKRDADAELSAERRLVGKAAPTAPAARGFPGSRERLSEAASSESPSKAAHRAARRPYRHSEVIAFKLRKLFGVRFLPRFRIERTGGPSGSAVCADVAIRSPASRESAMNIRMAGRAVDRRRERTIACRIRKLVACLSLALPATALPATGAIAAQDRPVSPTPTTWQVTNCSDGDTNSLRDVIENPNNAKSGDTIDLTQLPALCGEANSVITLLNGEIHAAQDSLTLMGPAAEEGTVAISGGGTSGVLHHTGTGTIDIHLLTLRDGLVHDAVNGVGGCIRSQGSVLLDHSVVTGCTAQSDSTYAHGGGVFAAGDVALFASSVSGNKLLAPNA
jgi:hypothetical protein